MSLLVPKSNKGKALSDFLITFLSILLISTQIMYKSDGQCLKIALISAIIITLIFSIRRYMAKSKV